MTGNQNATHTKSTKRNDSPRQMVASSLSTVVKPKPEIPAAPPVPKQKEIAGRRMPKRSNVSISKIERVTTDNLLKGYLVK